MIITFVDSQQMDQSGKSIILGTADVVSVPRMGEKQTLIFPNMPSQNYLVSDVARRTHIGGSASGGQLSPEMQQLPPMQQLILKQMALTTSQSQPPPDEIFVVLRKLDQEVTHAS